jgi:hypothetical protein
MEFEGGLDTKSTETLLSTHRALSRTLALVGQRFEDGTAFVVGKRGSAPAEIGAIALMFLVNVAKELDNRGVKV